MAGLARTQPTTTSGKARAPTRLPADAPSERDVFDHSNDFSRYVLVLHEPIGFGSYERAPTNTFQVWSADLTERVHSFALDECQRPSLVVTVDAVQLCDVQFHATTTFASGVGPCRFGARLRQESSRVWKSEPPVAAANALSPPEPGQATRRQT